MEEDFYKILGVARDASPDEIQKAYRKLARKHHPDVNQDDKAAKAKFQRIQKAYDVVGDAEKRKMYDQFGPSFEQIGPNGAGGGWQTPPGGGAGFGDIDFEQMFGQPFDGGGGGGPFGGFGDIFRQAAQGAAGQRGGRRKSHRGSDLQHAVEIPFNTAVIGGEVKLSIQRPGAKKSETLEVKIPAGVQEGQTIRLRGQGEPGGGIPGDLMLTIHIAAHPFFTRRENDLIVRVPVTLAEAALGAKVDVPTPWGTLTLTVPPGTSSGKRLRVKGHGVRPARGLTGDLFAEIQITLPPKLDETSLDLVRKFEEQTNHQPRTGFTW